MNGIADRTKGYLYVMAAAVLWASSGTMGKVLFQAGMTPSDLVQVRVTFATLILVAGLAAVRPRFLVVRSRDVVYLFLLGGVAMAMVQVTYFYTISQIQVMAAILLQYLSPVFVAVFSMLFWGERCTSGKLVALLLACAGCYLVVGGYNMDLLAMNRVGLLTGLLSAVLYAVYALGGEWAMRRYDPWTVVFYSFCFAAVTWNIIHPPFKFLFMHYDTDQWLRLLYIVVLGTVTPFSLYFLGINYLRSTQAMITATLEPISAGLIAFLFLGETLEPLQLAGAACVIAAIVTLQLQRGEDEQSPEAIRTESTGSR
jgi:drug/metabolite transporter (DMT)-like permease